jgi:hypothetical protein
MMVRVFAAGLVATVIMLGLQSWRLNSERLAHAETRQEHAVMVAASEAASRQAEAAARIEEQRRIAALQEVVNETESKLARARADADAARSAGDRLRQRLAELRGTCSRSAGDTAVATVGGSADATGDLLADVQRRLDDAADELARFADAAHAAGLACEQGWGALRR